MLDPLLNAIRADITRKLHEINGARIKRRVCIRQDPHLGRLCDEICADLLRLVELDPERANWYRRCVVGILDFRKQEPGRLKSVA